MNYTFNYWHVYEQIFIILLVAITYCSYLLIFKKNKSIFLISLLLIAINVYLIFFLGILVDELPSTNYSGNMPLYLSITNFIICVIGLVGYFKKVTKY